jgi:hypothetical protein
MTPGESPTGIAIDRKSGLIFSTCGSAIVTISDIKKAQVIGTVTSGTGTDSAGYDSSARIAFASNGEGTLSVIKSVDAKFVNVQNVATKKSARTMALDEKRHLVYLIAADFESPNPGERRGKMKSGSAEIIVVGAK